MIVETDAEVAEVGVEVLGSGVALQAEVVGDVGRNQSVRIGKCAVGLGAVVDESETSEVDVAVGRPVVADAIVDTGGDVEADRRALGGAIIFIVVS